MNLKTHIKIAFGYFFIVVLLGVFLRIFHVVDVDFNYKNILHAHSHIALLGWVYTVLTTLIYQIFLSEKQQETTYRKLFISTQVSIIGMMLTFPFTGYALLSIIFSTLFLLNSYRFVWLFMKHTSNQQKQLYSYKIIRAALWLMVFSSLGPLVLGIVMNTLGSTSPWYRNAIYFYLHFQYNGWFLVALIGLLFSVFEKQKLTIISKTFDWIFKLFISGVFLTFFLSILWMKLTLTFNVLAGIGGVLQLAAFGIFGKLILQNKENLKVNLSYFEGILLKIIALLFLIKLLLQFLGAFPNIALIVSNNIDFVIGYLHLIFLGIVSISLFVFLNYFRLIKLTKFYFISYFSAFILTEGLLFYKGIIVWKNFPLLENYYMFLFLTSAVFLVPIAGMLVELFKEK